MSVVDLLAYLRLQSEGFHFHRLSLASFFTLFPFRLISLATSHHSSAKRLSYWYRPHTSTNRLPVLFVHGVGIGLYPYTKFLSEINPTLQGHTDSEDGHVGVLAVEIMPISFRITHNALDRDEMCIELRQILADHDYDRFVLVSHSYGSVVSSFILADEELRLKVASALLVDPVSFLLHAPDVAYNFTVRQPRYANEWQLWYFASKDPGIAHTLGRRFFWSECVMWDNDVECFLKNGGRLTVTLGGKDLIVNTEAVGRHLAKYSANRALASDVRSKDEDLDCSSAHPTEGWWKRSKWQGVGLDVLWFGELDHGQVFAAKKARVELVKAVRGYCESA